jgi:hypothetical protein
MRSRCDKVLTLARLLVLLLALRLLVPQGVCLCHLPDACESDADGDDEDEHTPGCPESVAACDYLSAPAVSAPAPADCPWGQAPDAPASCPQPADFAALTPFRNSPNRPVFLTLRALLI